MPTIREIVSPKLAIGAKMPAFSLPSTSGEQFSSSELNSRGNLVIFMCNHCPYVLGTIGAILETLAKFNDIAVVGISSNDPSKYPDDSFENMKIFKETHKMPFPYLFDETQEVAKLFDAQCTPELYLFNKVGELVYHGSVNDSHRDPAKVTVNYLERALSQLSKEEAVDPAFMPSLGCSIKWR